MLSRLVARSAVPRALLKGRSTSAFVSSANFHAGPVRKERQVPADVSLDGPLVRYGLNDWKVSVPIGMALSVPFLANEWIILSEETQLLACFVAFTATAYKHGSGAIAQVLDDQQHAIISEINRLEDLEVKVLRETIAAAEVEKTIVEDLQFLDAKSVEISGKLEVALVGEAKAKVRDQYIGWLNTVAAMEKSSQKTAIDAFLDTTAAQVTKNFSTDAKLKKAAVDQVIQLLNNPNAELDDLVGAEFEKVAKAVWPETVGKALNPSKEALQSILGDLKALKGKEAPSEADMDSAVKLYYAAFKNGATASTLKL